MPFGSVRRTLRSPQGVATGSASWVPPAVVRRAAVESESDTWRARRTGDGGRAAYLDLVEVGRVLGGEQLDRGAAGGQDDAFAVVVPGRLDRQAEGVAVEGDGLVEVFDGEGEP